MRYTKEEQKQHRQEWVAALRSGEYEQTQSLLRDENGFCCMGVACDIYDSTKWNKVMAHTVEKGKFYCYNYMDNTTSLPSELVRYFGISDWSANYFEKDGNCSSLIDENDAGMPFHEIADIIESEPEGLVV